MMQSPISNRDVCLLLRECFITYVTFHLVSFQLFETAISKLYKSKIDVLKKIMVLYLLSIDMPVQIV